MKSWPRLLVVAALAVPPSAQAAPDFDAGPDASALLAEARRAAAESPDPAPVSVSYQRRTQRDCVVFTFRPEDPPQSDPVWLASTEWVTECRQVGDPQRGGTVVCTERPGMTWRERVRVTIEDRKPLLPWEADRFEVCLDGPWVDARAVDTAYEYRRLRGRRDGEIAVSPGRKLQTRPDPYGVAGELTAGLELELRDRWASHYAGEQIAVRVTLKRDVPNWFDAVLFDGELRVPAGASSFTLPLAGLQLSEQPQAGREYYAEYRISRIGAVSRPDWTPAQETPKTTFVPGPVAQR